MKKNEKKWHNIKCIEPNGEIKWVASYDGEFSAYYAMQLWWCNLHHYNFFNKHSLKKATEHIVTSKSLRSVMFDMDEDTYILTTKKNSNVMIGIGGCKEYEYDIKIAK